MNVNAEISGWLNKQHDWIREAAHRILSKGSVDDEDVADLVKLVKTAEPKTRDPRSFPAMSGDSAHALELRLNSIDSVEGIDALNPKKPLTFGVGNLAVVYGVNGSGKSGYTRIITKACGKAHSVDLKPNVYATPPQQQQSSDAWSVSLSPRGQSIAISWPSTSTASSAGVCASSASAG